MPSRSHDLVRALPLAIPAIIAIAVLSGCATGTNAPASPTPATSTTQPSLPPAPDDASRAEFEALFLARTDSALSNYSEADVDFIAGMIAHHAQALVMAGLADANDAGPQVRTLAARIRIGQQDEISLMQDWLRDRGLPVPEVHVDGVDMMVHGMQHAHDMPGMLTPEQMQQLGEARGADFDRLFLEYMIQHHHGAIVMVDALLGTDGAALDPLVFKLAAEIHAEQTTEIARMESMLDAMQAGLAP